MVLKTIGPMPSGRSIDIRKPMPVALEAAEVTAVIVLHQLGAGGEQVG